MVLIGATTKTTTKTKSKVNNNNKTQIHIKKSINSIKSYRQKKIHVLMEKSLHLAVPLLLSKKICVCSYDLQFIYDFQTKTMTNKLKTFSFQTF